MKNLVKRTLATLAAMVTILIGGATLFFLDYYHKFDQLGTFKATICMILIAELTVVITWFFVALDKYYEKEARKLRAQKRARRVA